ncbi:cyclodeaminase/cyclohydrolase family protein [Bacillus benzoevorans]|uniref:Formiminotetrahydrofolate cyclodeaminase n=1 Tax=Bacillus benzoevorans TaxID=1456 RepID=A0A7X0LY02_9BACI|nr:cyclodeaminase/cyclohydrolase family protein [Bacillus benzoevorans]MBB6447012.1 formiminotetrahydrofolate cyclodeaminase [Bacillus benzoevorans]
MERIDYLLVHEYLEKLADPSFPGPASGSAAATIAAMAAALLEMSCKVTMKNGGGNIPLALNEIEVIRQHCLALATEDMEVLAEVVRAAKSRKENPEKYECAIRNATDTLVSLVKNCEFILREIEQLIPVCNKKVVAELIGSTHMAEAALASAKLGVEVNLHLLHDENYKESVQGIMKNSYKNSIEMKERILNIVNK